MQSKMVIIDESELRNLIEDIIKKCLNEKLENITQIISQTNSTSNDDNQLILTFDEVCEMLRVKETTLFNLIKQNKIKSYKNGGKRQFLIEDVKSYINEVKNTSNNEVLKWK